MRTNDADKRCGHLMRTNVRIWTIFWTILLEYTDFGGQFWCGRTDVTDRRTSHFWATPMQKPLRGNDQGRLDRAGDSRSATQIQEIKDLVRLLRMLTWNFG